MGQLSKMDVIYDTGSDWLVIEGSDCTDCEGNTYNIGPGLDSGTASVLTGETVERSYGKASFTGKLYKDTVCILFSACIRDFEFFLIETQSGLKEPVDGIMGLARNKPQHLAPEKGNVTGPLYIEKLVEEGIISQNKFSFYIQEAGKESWLDLG